MSDASIATMLKATRAAVDSGAKAFSPSNWPPLFPKRAERRSLDGYLKDLPTSLREFCIRHWRPLTLLCLSAILTALYVIGRPYILYNDGDPLTYFRKAWWFIGHEGGMDVPSRGPGYPIWLILTGAASLDFWWGLVASQVLMAMTAPALVYAILAPISRNAGFVAGLLFIAFGISYEHMNWVMVEELFLFVELLSLLLISRYLCGAWAALPPRPATDVDLWTRGVHGFQSWLSTPYPIALLLAYDTLIKPSASPFFWLFIIVCVVFRVDNWKRYVGPMLLYMAIMTAWGTYDYLHSPVRFSPLGMPTTSAQRNFADVYFRNRYNAVRGWEPIETAPATVRATQPPPPPADVSSATIRPGDGPASKRLYQAVATRVAANRKSGKWNEADPSSAFQLYGRHQSDANLVNLIFARPNPAYFRLVLSASATAGGDRLLYDVAREHYNTGVFAFAKYLAHHPTVPFMGSPNPYVGFMFFMKFYRYRDYLAVHDIGMRNLFLGSYHQNMIAEKNGPGSVLYGKSVRYFIDAFPQYVFPHTTYLQDFGTADKFADYAVTNPYFSKYSGSLMGNIYQWFLLLYGEEGAGRLMGTAALEATLNNPAALGLVVGDFLAAAAYSGSGYYVGLPKLITDFPQAFSGARTVNDTLLTATVESAKQNNLPKSLAKFVGVVRERGTLSKNMNALLGVSYGVFKWVKPILFISMLVISLPLIIFGIGGRLVAFLVMAYFVSAAAFTIVMIMPGSDPRHEDVYSFFPLLITTVGVFAIPEFIRAANRRWQES